MQSPDVDMPKHITYSATVVCESGNARKADVSSGIRFMSKHRFRNAKARVFKNYATVLKKLA
jgi:hypothetical protein